MITVSNDFKTAMKQPVKELKAYIKIDDNNYIKSEDDLISIKISGEGAIGKTTMRKLEAKYIGEHSLLGIEISVGFGVKLPTNTFEYLDYGTFLVTEITTSKDTGTTTIVGYDLMIKAMTKYNLKTSYPITLFEYAENICRQCGLELGSETFVHSDWSIPQELYKNIEGVTYRDVLVEIAKATASICIIGNDNKVYFKYINDTQEQLTYANMFKLKLEPIYGEINSVVLSRTPQEDNIYMEDTYSITKKSSSVNICFNQWEIGHYSMTTGKKENYPSRCRLDDYIEVSPKDSLYLDTNSIDNEDNFIVRYLDKDKNFISSLGDIGVKKSIIVPENVKYLGITIHSLKHTDNEYGIVLLDKIKNGKIKPYISLEKDKSCNWVEFKEQGRTEFKIENNQIIDKDRDTAMIPIFNTLHGIKYYPFEIDTEGLGWYEIGDRFNIQNDTGDIFSTILFEFSISVDGGIKEKLLTKEPSKTQTQYQYATTIAKRVKNTEIIVNKQEQYIENLVTDMYEEDGVVHENFTKVKQDIDGIINSIQNTGGNNLLKNSVMFAYDNNDVPENWIVSGSGTLDIQSSTEALNSGSISGHIFILNNKTVKQRVNVKANSSNTPDDKKVYYTFSCKIKKDIIGNCYVKISNSNESYLIEILEGQDSFYGDYEIKALLPKLNYYDIEFYGSSSTTFTDCMFSLGEYKSQWQQASGEIMNTQVNINLNGVLVKSSVYLGDYTIMSPLEFAGYSNINGTITKVFSLNKDVTLVKKLEAEDEIKMLPIKIVPRKSGDITGWAFVPTT